MMHVLIALAALNWLLVDSSEVEAAREKAARHAWARAALDRVLADADRALKSPIDIPARGGQWPHWYSCPRDGVTLRAASPTGHRCPKCGAVYTGDPYDAVALYRVHLSNSRAVRDLALAYRLAGKEEYAARARELLLGYAQRYGTYALHNTRGEPKVGGGRIMAQTLDEAVWLIPVAWGYSMVRETLAPEDRARVERDLLLPAAEVIRAHRMGIHNIQCWKNSAVGVVGFATGNQELVREAIDDAERGFRAQIARGVTAAGLWFEGSLGYHRYTMDALWPLAEAARRAGIDLYTERYRSLYQAPLALALPNGDAPGFNDNSGGNVAAAAPLYELAYARWKTPAYGSLAARSSRDSVQALLYGAEQPPSGPMIPTESTLLDEAGFAVLRSPGVAIAQRFGMHGGSHGHPDKLNIVTYGAGRTWGLDPGSINYGVPLHREWYRSTIAHNTVAVDEGLQDNTDGKLVRWENNTLETSADGVYPGVALRRTVELKGTRAKDRFECRSEAAHVYDWAFHAAGKVTTSLALVPRPGPLGSANGYQHINSVSAARTDSTFWVRWERDGARLTLRMEGAPETEVFLGEGPGRDPAGRVPVLVVRRRGQSAVFAAVHEFGE
ncbi:MAG: alginate lyase family protein [Bryobacteraceae bacterium]